LDGQGAGCRTWSAYAVAGYLPTAPETIEAHLLQMMAEGSAVGAVPGTPYHVLGRRSLADPTWRPPLTMVDFASELFGLSTKWLGLEFWQQNTAHWDAPIIRDTLQQELDNIEGSWKSVGTKVAAAVSSYVSPVLGSGLKSLFETVGGAAASKSDHARAAGGTPSKKTTEEGRAEVLDTVSDSLWTAV